MVIQPVPVFVSTGPVIFLLENDVIFLSSYLHPSYLCGTDEQPLLSYHQIINKSEQFVRFFYVKK
jgi:hypothetical protein